MPNITDGFNRQTEKSYEINTEQMSSLLREDIKVRKSKKAMDDESPEQAKARKKIEDNLEKLVKQGIDKELKELRETLERSTKLNEKYYKSEKTEKPKKRKKAVTDVTEQMEAWQKKTRGDYRYVRGDLFGLIEQVVKSKYPPTTGAIALKGSLQTAEATAALGKNVVKSVATALTSEKPIQEFLGSFGQLAGGLARLVPFGVGEGLGRLIEPVVNEMMKPVIQELDYYQALRQTAAENLGITKGAVTPTGDAKKDLQNRLAQMDMQEKALAAFQVGSEQFIKTGQSLLKIEKVQITNLRRGIREVETLDRVTTAGLNTATMLGSSAEETSSLFADLHQNLQFSANDLSYMSRSFRDIARTTGLTGDSLIKVAKGAEEFMKNLRDSGMLKPQAAEGLTRLLAEAATTGNTEAMNKILAVITQSALAPGNEKIKLLIFKALEGFDDLQDQFKRGTLELNQEVMGIIGKGFKRIIDESVTGEGGGIDTLFTKLFYDIGLGDLKISSKNFENAAKELGKRYKEISDMKLPDEMKQRQKQYLEMAIATKYIQKFSSAVDKATERGGGLNEAFDDLNKDIEVTSERMKRDFGAIGEEEISKYSQEGIEKMLRRYVESVNKGITDVTKKIGYSPETKTVDVDAVIKQAMKTPESIKEFIGTIGEAQKIETSQAKIMQDLVTDTNLKLERIRMILATGLGRRLPAAMAIMAEDLRPILDTFSKGDIMGGFTMTLDYIKNSWKHVNKELIPAIDEMQGIDQETKDFLKIGLKAFATASIPLAQIIDGFDKLKDILTNIPGKFNELSTAVVDLTNKIQNLTAMIPGGAPTTAKHAANLATGFMQGGFAGAALNLGAGLLFGGGGGGAAAAGQAPANSLPTQMQKVANNLAKIEGLLDPTVDILQREGDRQRLTDFKILAAGFYEESRKNSQDIIAAVAAMSPEDQQKMFIKMQKEIARIQEKVIQMYKNPEIDLTKDPEFGILLQKLLDYSKATSDILEPGKDPGSFFVHDVHAEEHLMAIEDGINEIQPVLSSIFSAFMDPEIEARKRQLAVDTTHDQNEAISDELQSIDDNAQENVNQTKKVVALLDIIRRLLTSPKKTVKGQYGSQEDIFEEAIYDTPLNTEWVASQFTDTTSIDVDIDRT